MSIPAGQLRERVDVAQRFITRTAGEQVESYRLPQYAQLEDGTLAVDEAGDFVLLENDSDDITFAARVTPRAGTQASDGQEQTSQAIQFEMRYRPVLGLLEAGDRLTWHRQHYYVTEATVDSRRRVVTIDATRTKPRG